MIHAHYEDRNPLYPEAMRLCDAEVGVNFLTFSTSSGNFWFTTLTSTYRVESDFEGVNGFIEESYVAARDSQGGEVNLSDCGIHPSHRGWDPDTFSVVVDHDSIRAFHSWTSKNGYIDATEKLERLYPELMLG